MKRFRWLAAILLALALIASSCGDDDDATGTDDGTTEPTATLAPGATPEATATMAPSGPEDYDPDGVLRLQYFMARMVWTAQEKNSEGAAGDIWGNGSTHLAVYTQVMGTPLVLSRTGEYEPFLAESYEIVDPSTVNLTLRAGLTFHDGTPYTAQILADFMMMIAGWEGHPIHATTQVGKITSIDVNSDTEMTFHLSAPVAGLFPDTLTTVVAMPASPTSNPPETVYGAGPYKIVDFQFEDHLTLEKYDDFFDADKYLLKHIELLNIPDLTAAANALEGDQVDMIATVASEVDSLVQKGPFASVVTNNQGHYTLAVCNGYAPFDDPKFREAVDLAINREQLVQVVLAGNGVPMASLWPPGFPNAREGLIDTDGDVEKAKALLAEINWDPNTEVVMGHYPGFQVHILIAETVIGQLAKVGIKAKLTEYPSYQYAEVLNPETGGFGVIANVNPGVLSVQFHNNGVANGWNQCAFQDAELQAMLDKVIAGDLSEAELDQTWTDINERVTSNHWWYPLMTQPAVYVYNSDKVAGVQPGTIGLTGATAISSFFDGIYVKTS